MAINKAEQTLEDQLIKRIVQLERDNREIKTVQRIGADVITITSSPSGSSPLSAGPFNLVAGSYITLSVTSTPASQVLTLWNFAFTIYIDGTDVTHQFPGGSALTSNSRESYIFNWLDWADSSDTTNIRVYKIRIRNSDPSLAAHDYYLSYKAYLPLTTVGSG